MHYRFVSWLAILLFSCGQSAKNEIFKVDELAANEEVASYLKGFEGRGMLSDDSNPTQPSEALKAFLLPEDLTMDLVLSEPRIHQPLELTFDHRGRLWVVQYNQYPYPEGLKVTGIDNHLRAEFDKIPGPPPDGAQGADKITVFEDTNGDGTFDKSIDAITGLNIATGVEFGRGKIWVLNPPYLLAYPDLQTDGLPDGPPEIHLRGFGLEDTHAVANSLRWGPDGWLYGATGSTVTSNISSSVTKNVHFEGQAIWRYHPEHEVFELFAEGGGNTFHVEIDAKGRIYSGDNGANTRGQYYKQGAYYVKNWGKHGPLTNPYAFGYLKNMKLEGDALRFTHAWIKYQGNSLPDSYRNKIISINPLLNYLQLSDFKSDGSTFITIDEKRLVETKDHWFRPVDIKAGPDGAVYLADWYDSRLSHVDPRDTWHKSSGRIYRIRKKDYSTIPAFDFSTYSNQQLISALSHSNKWHRQQAIRQFGDRKELANVDQLVNLLTGNEGQLALEALWALHISGHFDDRIAILALKHQDPYVRMWGIRLLGDRGSVTKKLAEVMEDVVTSEHHPEVQSQYACSAKRLPAVQAVPIIHGLVQLPGIEKDPDNPLLIWWAIESKLDEDGDLIIEMIEKNKLWTKPVIKETILERLAQRLVMKGSVQSYDQCARLLGAVPDTQSARPILEGIQEALRGKDTVILPSNLLKAMDPHLKAYNQAPLTLKIQQRDEEAIELGLMVISDQQANVNERLVYIRLMGKLRIGSSQDVLIKVVENTSDRISVRQAAIKSLSSFEYNEIGSAIASAYPDRLRADPELKVAALNLLASRSAWAKQLLGMIEINKSIDPDDVPLQIIRQMQLLQDNEINVSLERIWPEASAVSVKEKQKIMQRISNAVGSGSVDFKAGKELYGVICGNCHILYNQGGSIGPNLTGYDRTNLNYLIINTVDPSIDIREGFVNYKVVTNDEQVLSGTVVNRSSEVVVLRAFNGDETIISTREIKQMEALGTSLMPERLVDNLSDQQLRNLFGYIMKNDYEESN